MQTKSQNYFTSLISNECWMISMTKQKASSTLQKKKKSVLLVLWLFSTKKILKYLNQHWKKWLIEFTIFFAINLF